MPSYLSNNGSWWWEVSNDNNELAMVIVTISVVMLAIIFWYSKQLLFPASSSPSLPPGPRSLPIVGYLPFLRPELHKQLTTMGQSYGPIFKFYLGSTVYVVINDQDLVKAVVREEDETFSNHKLTVAAAVASYGGQDVGFSNDSYWRNVRKIFVHEVLSNKNVEECSPFRRDEVRKTIKNIYSKIGTTIDIGEISFTTVINVITRMVRGNTSDGEGEIDIEQIAELKSVSEKIMMLLGRPNVSDLFPSLAWFDVQGIERDMKKQAKKLDQILTSLFEERIKSNSKKLDIINGVGRKGKKDFLQVLIELKDKKEINDTQMKALIQDIMIGGSDRIITLIEWAMTEIIKNHEVMKRIQEELAEVVGINNIVEEYHLLELKYLEATMKETFRLHPLVPFLIPRSPNKDSIVGGYTIPKGCIVFINMWSIHRDPRYWKNPLEFNPERFFNLEGIDRCDFRGNNLKYLPFGAGRRMCPGISLANKMDMYILASLLHSFNWSLPKGYKHDVSETFGMTLKKPTPLLVIPAQKLPSVSLYM